MSSSCCHSQETNSQIRRQSVSSTTSDDEDFIDDDDSNDRSIEPIEKHSTNNNKNKKTLGRVKIKMAYIDNKIRRYTTFSKRKTGIMKKAYELATLTGTEVMLLVASETGHVYTYATAKLQPMITSEAGKALIQTCLAKDEPIIEQIVDTPTTTLNNNDVIFIDENQRKKRLHTSIDNQSINVSNGNRPIKCAKLSSLNKIKSTDTLNSQTFSTPSQTTTLTLPCFIQSDPQQQQSNIPSSYTIDLNALKNNGMNIIFAPSTTNTSESSLPSNSPLVLTLSNFSYQPS
ncbi:unnamed protein product [Rotaria sp. Silwood2]|nr:unnamed protein product [Rotaria sp. Silwood2]CAF2630716.1 unnamed protein product [Rotaria sp. Silwood2]CAF3043881.1 unnamed protein product [Rotaria sp. Silwood2]CAF3880839.1 unnamed protein product [Rotaria sp. Silwood2]CAF4037527.1 unnamed protein product [Rotaria sp. Silwood2]